MLLNDNLMNFFIFKKIEIFKGGLFFGTVYIYSLLSVCSVVYSVKSILLWAVVA